MYKVYNVWDEGVKVFTSSFNAINDGQAKRVVEDDVNRQGHPFNAHTGQFTLFEIGDYDETKGLHIPYKTPIEVVSLIRLKKDVDGNYLPQLNREQKRKAKKLGIVPLV